LAGHPYTAAPAIRSLRTVPRARTEDRNATLCRRAVTTVPRITKLGPNLSAAPAPVGLAESSESLNQPAIAAVARSRFSKFRPAHHAETPARTTGGEEGILCQSPMDLEIRCGNQRFRTTAAGCELPKDYERDVLGARSGYGGENSQARFRRQPSGLFAHVSAKHPRCRAEKARYRKAIRPPVGMGRDAP
jgi:hypothetical protein